MPLGNPYTDVGNAQKAGFQMPRVQPQRPSPVSPVNFGGLNTQRANMTNEMNQMGGALTPELADKFAGQMQWNQQIYNEDGSLKDPNAMQPQQQMPQEPPPFMLPGQAGMQRRTNPLFFQK